MFLFQNADLGSFWFLRQVCCISRAGVAKVLGGSANRFQTLLGPEACSQGMLATFRPGSGCPWRGPPTHVPAVALA